jgi:hypothetical protein
VASAGRRGCRRTGRAVASIQRASGFPGCRAGSRHRSFGESSPSSSNAERSMLNR